MNPTVTLIIVNCKTLKQTQLCLRSIRHYTHYPCDVIVVDNNSADESLAYLRSLSWIRLIENPAEEPTHRNALDLAIQSSESDIVVAMHSDTYVCSHDWLEKLLSYMDEGTMIVGSQDRVIMPATVFNFLSFWWKRRKMERRWRKIGLPAKIITHCVLYRRSLFTEHGQKFDYPQWIDGVYNDAGEFVQRYCEQNDFGIKMLCRSQFAEFLWHFEAATLNLFRARAIPQKRQARSRAFYDRQEIRCLLENEALDA